MPSEYRRRQGCCKVGRAAQRQSKHDQEYNNQRTDFCYFQQKCCRIPDSKENHGFFKEGGGKIDSLTALCYYAADRRYNLPIIEKYLQEGYTLIIDRYVTSNMAHRGGLLETKEERLKMYQKIETLEYDLLELPRPDQVILLYMPYEYACLLKKERNELPDEVEKDEVYLKRGEQAYLELANLYHYDIINCIKDNHIRSIEEINEDIYKLVSRKV